MNYQIHMSMIITKNKNNFNSAKVRKKLEEIFCTNVFFKPGIREDDGHWNFNPPRKGIKHNYDGYQILKWLKEGKQVGPRTNQYTKFFCLDIDRKERTKSIYYDNLQPVLDALDDLGLEGRLICHNSLGGIKIWVPLPFQIDPDHQNKKLERYLKARGLRVDRQNLDLLAKLATKPKQGRNLYQYQEFKKGGCRAYIDNNDVATTGDVTRLPHTVTEVLQLHNIHSSPMEFDLEEFFCQYWDDCVAINSSFDNSTIDFKLAEFNSEYVEQACWTVKQALSQAQDKLPGLNYVNQVLAGLDEAGAIPESIGLNSGAAGFHNSKIPYSKPPVNQVIDLDTARLSGSKPPKTTKKTTAESTSKLAGVENSVVPGSANSNNSKIPYSKSTVNQVIDVDTVSIPGSKPLKTTSKGGAPKGNQNARGTREEKHLAKGIRFLGSSQDKHSMVDNCLDLMNQGWTGPGQSMDMLAAISVVVSYTYRSVTDDAAIAREIKTIAMEMKGYQEFASDSTKADLERSIDLSWARRWAKSVLKYREKLFEEGTITRKHDYQLRKTKAHEGYIRGKRGETTDEIYWIESFQADGTRRNRKKQGGTGTGKRETKAEREAFRKHILEVQQEEAELFCSVVDQQIELEENFELILSEFVEKPIEKTNEEKPEITLVTSSKCYPEVVESWHERFAERRKKRWKDTAKPPEPT